MKELLRSPVPRAAESAKQIQLSDNLSRVRQSGTHSDRNLAYAPALQGGQPRTP